MGLAKVMTGEAEYRVGGGTRRQMYEKRSKSIQTHRKLGANMLHSSTKVVM
jgi:hypothetical protein